MGKHTKYSKKLLESLVKDSISVAEVMKQLKKEFGCSTLNEAKRKLKQLEKQEVESKEKFDSAVEKFEEDWPDNE